VARSRARPASPAKQTETSWPAGRSARLLSLLPNKVSPQARRNGRGSQRLCAGRLLGFGPKGGLQTACTASKGRLRPSARPVGQRPSQYSMTDCLLPTAMRPRKPVAGLKKFSGD